MKSYSVSFFVFAISALLLPRLGVAGIENIIFSTNEGFSFNGETISEGDVFSYDKEKNQGSFLHKEVDIFGASNSLNNIDAIHFLNDGRFILSTESESNINGTFYQSSDLILYDPYGKNADLYFEASSLGAGLEIDAVYFRNNKSIIISTALEAVIEGVTYRPSDLIEYDPLEKNTTLLFDGAIVTSLTDNPSNIDAVSVKGNGNLLMSFSEKVLINGVEYDASDIVEYDISTKVVTLYLDGNVFNGAGNINALYISSYVESELMALVEVIATPLAYDQKSMMSSTDVYIVNREYDFVITPIRLVIDTISSSEVQVLNADGITPDGKPYFEFYKKAGLLKLGEQTEQKTIRFHTSKKKPFKFETKVVSLLSEQGLAKIRYDADGDGIPNQEDELPFNPDLNSLTGVPENYVEILDIPGQNIKLYAESSMVGSEELEGVSIKNVAWRDNKAVSIDFNPSGKIFSKPLLVSVDLSNFTDLDLVNPHHDFLVENFSNGVNQIEIYRPFYDPATRQLYSWVPHFSTINIGFKPTFNALQDVSFSRYLPSEFSIIAPPPDIRPGDIGLVLGIDSESSLLDFKGKVSASTICEKMKTDAEFKEKIQKKLINGLKSAVVDALNDFNNQLTNPVKPYDFELVSGNLDNGKLVFSVFYKAPSQLHEMTIKTQDAAIATIITQKIKGNLSLLEQTYDVSFSTDILNAATKVESSHPDVVSVARGNVVGEWNLTALSAGGIGSNEHFIKGGKIEINLSHEVKLTWGGLNKQGRSVDCPIPSVKLPSPEEFGALKPSVSIKSYNDLPFSVYDLKVYDSNNQVMTSINGEPGEIVNLRVKHSSPNLFADGEKAGNPIRIGDTKHLDDFTGYETNFEYKISSNVGRSVFFVDSFYDNTPSYLLELLVNPNINYYSYAVGYYDSSLVEVLDGSGYSNSPGIASGSKEGSSGFAEVIDNGATLPSLAASAHSIDNEYTRVGIRSHVSASYIVTPTFSSEQVYHNLLSRNITIPIEVTGEASIDMSIKAVESDMWSDAYKGNFAYAETIIGYTQKHGGGDLIHEVSPDPIQGGGIDDFSVALHSLNEKIWVTFNSKYENNSVVFNLNVGVGAFGGNAKSTVSFKPNIKIPAGTFTIDGIEYSYNEVFKLVYSSGK